MDLVTSRPQAARSLGAARRNGALLAVFSVTLFLSALLLFSVQPMFAKMVLPQLGGTPSVWAVSMCFFQATLLAGYCYAHALDRFVASRHVPAIHLGLLTLALLALPVGLPPGAEPPAGDAYLWLLGTLALGLGLPFFAVSASAPLLQAWFARSGHPHSANPYFLYGASNLGSLVALLAYPTVIEPALGLSVQGRLWAGALAMLVLLIATCGILTLSSSGKSDREPGLGAEGEVDPISWGRRLAWVGLAFVPSGLLVAFTSYLTTDIASAPLLWVVPLALFLATFILVFRERPFIPHRWMLAAQPILVIGTLLGLAVPGNGGWLLAVPMGLGAFFVTAMVCHKELYDHRPASCHLTGFYLYMSFGGVLGGVFPAIVAPQIFNAIYEFPILLVLGAACRPGLSAALADRAEVRRGGRAPAALALAVLISALALAVLGAPPVLHKFSVLVAISTASILMLATRDRPYRHLAYAAVAGLGLLALPSAVNSGFSERSFFGVHRVLMTADGTARLLMHGTTLHGAERLKDAEGQQLPRPIPVTYYSPHGPIARGVEAARQAADKPDAALVVGIVGLGTGSMACHARAGEAWRFYEIDPVVVKLARDPKLFSFLARCLPNADIVLGDARLTLAKEPEEKFDYLVIDAFSSDAVPVHLLTRQALQLFLEKLGPNGILALHVSNRHMDLVGVAAATLGSLPGIHAAYVYDRKGEGGLDRTPSQVVLASKAAAAFEAVRAWGDAAPLGTSDVAPWTDDYSDVLSAIWRRYRP